MCMISELHARCEPHNPGRQVFRAIVRTDERLEHHARLNLDFLSAAKVIHHFHAVGAERFRWPGQWRSLGQVGARYQRCIDLSVASGGCEHCVQTTDQKTTIRAQADHAKALLPALKEVCFTSGDHATTFAGRCNRVLDLQQLLANARPLPLTCESSRAGVVGWTEHKHLYAVYIYHLADVLPAADRLNHGHD